eukprot:347464-Chlamydomonas_euryale.AAC.1
MAGGDATWQAGRREGGAKGRSGTAWTAWYHNRGTGSEVNVLLQVTRAKRGGGEVRADRVCDQ